jgi:hypothetical protein
LCCSLLRLDYSGSSSNLHKELLCVSSGLLVAAK